MSGEDLKSIFQHVLPGNQIVNVWFIIKKLKLTVSSVPAHTTAKPWCKKTENYYHITHYNITC